MRSNAEQMETQIALLEAKVAEITVSSESIDAKLAPVRTRIHQLSGVHNLIQKLSFVFELPNRLTECLKKKQFVQSVLLYSKASTLLSHYRHIPAFKQIEDECQAIMVNIGDRVKHKLVSDKTTISKISENIGLMIGLGNVNHLDVAKEYISRVAFHINKMFDSETRILFDEAQLIYNAKSTRASSSERRSITANQQSELATKLSAFNIAFLSQVCEFVKCYDAFFLKPYDVSIHSSNPTQNGSKELEELKKTIFIKSMSAEDRETAKNLVITFATDMESKYFVLIDKLLVLPEDISRASTTSYVDVLEIIRKDISKATALHSLIEIEVKAAENTASILNKIISGVFSRVKHEFAARWKAIQVGNELDVFTIVRELTNWIKETLIAHALPILENFVTPESTPSSSFASLERIQTTLLSFWKDLGDDMISGTAELATQKSQHILILSRLALEWSKGSVEAVFSMYAERIFNDVSRNTFNRSPTQRGQRKAAANEPDLITKGQQIASDFKNVSKALLKRYLEYWVLSITKRIHLYTESLTSISSIGDVSKTWTDICEDLLHISQEVKKTFDDEADASRRVADQSKRSKGFNANAKPATSNQFGSSTVGQQPPRGNMAIKGGKFGHLLNDIDKLFEERIEYLPVVIVEINKAVVLNALCKVALKVFLNPFMICSNQY